jgi:RNA polymerase sigma-70 factor (ECF subfamily)
MDARDAAPDASEPRDGSLDELVARARSGDEAATAALFERFRARLRRTVELRLDRRLRGRVDASDVLQEAYLDVARKVPTYDPQDGIGPFLWLRFVTTDRLARVHRQHLDAAMRDAARDVSLRVGPGPVADSATIAKGLFGRLSSPSQRAIRAEVQESLQQLLNDMEPLDREILVLRHFEELGNAEAAKVLKLKPAAASNRYVRALGRLRRALEATPGLNP